MLTPLVESVPGVANPRPYSPEARERDAAPRLANGEGRLENA
jgi:hypothetical protein